MSEPTYLRHLIESSCLLPGRPHSEPHIKAFMQRKAFELLAHMVRDCGYDITPRLLNWCLDAAADEYRWFYGDPLGAKPRGILSA